METIRQKYGWIISTLLGSLIFALGFDLFLVPNNLNPGGISGLSVIIVEVLGFGSVGTLSILINLPLFALGGIKIGKRFFIGSLIGMVTSSMLIDLLVLLPAVCYGFGYTRGPGLRAVVHTSIRKNNRKRQKREKRTQRDRAMQQPEQLN